MVQSLVGPLLKVLKQLSRKCYIFTLTSVNAKWLDFRVFSDKDVKIVGTSDPLSIGKYRNSLLGNPLTNE
jgi:hypothetical protein